MITINEKTERTKHGNVVFSSAESPTFKGYLFVAVLLEYVRILH